ncbi:MAG: NAD(P)/FAD-dependent oxidoreductase [Flavobacteriales bacterium]|nr:NAD(P)/FAD-dependent oxidoreductase [Flavobacteriales bacterium]
MGGLACAIILGKAGYKVTVLEKNRQFGGNLQIFVRDKALFDTGVHYVGGLDKGQNLYKCFKYFEIMDDLKLMKCDEDRYDIVTFGDDEKEYRHAQGYDNFVAQLLKDFPEEEEGLKKYVDKLQEVCREFPLYQLRKEKTNTIISESLEINTRAFIDSCTKNEKLRSVLAGTNSLYGGLPDETPLYVHALILNSYIEGAYKFIDGGSQIERLLVRIIKKYGGQVLKYKNVKRIVCDDSGKAEYVETAEGEQFKADIFISNADINKTIEMVENSRIRKAYTNRIKGLKTTISAFIVNLVLKKDTFPYQNYNHYHHMTEDAWEGAVSTMDTWPTGYAIFCPPNSKNPDYADCVTVLAYMNYDDVKEWKDTFHTVPHQVNERAEEYLAFKEKCAQKLIDIASIRYPVLKGNIESVYTSTPLSYRDYIGTYDGSLYGIAKDYKDPTRTFITPRTKVPNLLLTGQNINMHGILGVTISALVTCGQIIPTNDILDRIEEAQ